MISAVDTSVVIAAYLESDRHHKVCRKLLRQGELAIYSHGLSEIFSIMTGGRLGVRVPTDKVAAILENEISKSFKLVSLGNGETMRAYRECEERGIRGGAIYDYLHLVAARKAGARNLYTLNTGDFLSFHRSGDPKIAQP